MAITNHEPVDKALELIKGELGPFVQREITSIHTDRTATEAGWVHSMHHFLCPEMNVTLWMDAKNSVPRMIDALFLPPFQGIACGANGA